MSMSLDISAGGDMPQRPVPGEGLRPGVLRRGGGAPRFRCGAGAGGAADQRGQHAGLRRAGRRHRSWWCSAARRPPTTLDGLKDWLLTNANNYLILPSGRAGTDFAAAGVGARFHRGFLEALEMVWEPLLAAMDRGAKGQGAAAVDHRP